MSWEIAELGDLVKIRHGYAFKSKYFADEGEYVLLTPGNFQERGGLKLKGENEKYYVGDIPEEYVLNGGDLIVVMTDLINTAPILGGSAIIPEDNKFLHNQRLGLVQIKDGEKIDKSFLYYLFNTDQYRGQVRGSASGATVRHTAPERIYRCKVRIPTSVETQRRIASILSAYDDLIENNLRRIKLLEESARQLYKEWFVRLRFPGHEHTWIVNGVPEGWKTSRLGDVIQIRKGKSITQANVHEGKVPVVAGGLQPAYYHNEANVKGPVITISASGANAGAVMIYHQDIWASDCSYISSESTDHLYYFYCLLKSMQQEVSGLQKGAAQPHVYPKDLMRLDIVFPADRTIQYFTEAVGPSFRLVKNLTQQNRFLIAARDILLPKLMSGEVEVDVKEANKHLEVTI